MSETAVGGGQAAPRALVGAALCLGSWAAFSLQDAIVKSLVVDLPVPEVLFGRSVVIVALVVAFLNRADYRALSIPAQPALDLAALGADPDRLGLLLPRLAHRCSSPSSSPIISSRRCSWWRCRRRLLKERVGFGRWAATLLGLHRRARLRLAGGGAPLAPVGLALLAAFAWALTTILARSLAKGITTPAMMMAGSIGFLVACGAMLPAIGVWPSLKQALAMGVLGLRRRPGAISLVRRGAPRRGVAARDA